MLKVESDAPETPKTPVLKLNQQLKSPSMLSPAVKKTLFPTVQSLESLPVYEVFEDSGFELIEEIGSGAFGSVWRAMKGKEFAIKKFNIKKQEARNGFARELAAQVFIESDSKDFCEDSAVCGTTAFIVENQNQNSAFIVYPFVVAIDLATLIEERSKRPQGKENLTQERKKDILNLLSLIALGVDFLRNIAKMHENNIAHRDIKPENILVNKAKKEHSVFIDFGSACFLSNSDAFNLKLTQLFDRIEKQIGNIDRQLSCIPIDTTLLYIDPELAEMDEVNDKEKDLQLGKEADLFAAAIVLFELFLERRATSIIKSKNPITLLHWRPDTKILLEKAGQNKSLIKTYMRLSMLINNMLNKTESADVFAEQLNAIGSLLRQE